MLSVLKSCGAAAVSVTAGRSEASADFDTGAGAGEGERFSLLARSLSLLTGGLTGCKGGRPGTAAGAWSLRRALKSGAGGPVWPGGLADPDPLPDGLTGAFGR